MLGSKGKISDKSDLRQHIKKKHIKKNIKKKTTNRMGGSLQIKSLIRIYISRHVKNNYNSLIKRQSNF